MAFTTIPSAGAKLRASVLSALITEVRPVAAFKTTDTSRSSTITRTADPDLTIALPANSEWDFHCVLIIETAASAAGDFSGEWDYPANANVSYGVIALVDTLAGGLSADAYSRGLARDATAPTTQFDVGVSTSRNAVLISGRIVLGATAGSLTLNWAQLSSNANATVLQDGSRLIAHRVS